MRLLTSSLQHTQVNSQHLGGAVVPLARRFLHPSTVTMGHGSHSSDNKPDIIEQEKQRNLTGGGKGEAEGNAGLRCRSWPPGSGVYLQVLELDRCMKAVLCTVLVSKVGFDSK